jgi:hypothetical protein
MDLTIPRVVKNWKYADKIVQASEGFEANGFGHKVAREAEVPYWKEAFEEFGLIPHVVEPLDRNFTAVHYLDGACTHMHKDVAPEGFVHVRCNVLLEKPNKGGHPIIDGKALELEKNDLWILLASLENHGSIKISGGKRVIYSFGALVEKTQVAKLLLDSKRV